MWKRTLSLLARASTNSPSKLICALSNSRQISTSLQGYANRNANLYALCGHVNSLTIARADRSPFNIRSQTRSYANESNITFSDLRDLRTEEDVMALHSLIFEPVPVVSGSFPAPDKSQLNKYKETEKRMKKLFVDKIRCLVRSGKGGNGCVSFLRLRYMPNGGPDGGNGGRGGNVVIVADPTKTNLSSINYHQCAQNGEDGRAKNCHGKDGKDCIIPVPLGTIVRDIDTGEILADLDTPNSEFIIAYGGTGGKGNAAFSTSTRRSPRMRTLGRQGENRLVELELKSIADVGLVGYPNAGKSTFLGAVSKAKPETAPYPFTTIHPSVGEVELDDFFTFKIADTPGLIEGAHLDVGLGHDFLRHIERNKILAYVVDVSGLEGMGIKEEFDEVTGERRLKYEFMTPEEDEAFIEDKPILTREQMLEQELQQLKARQLAALDAKQKEIRQQHLNLSDYGLEDDDEDQVEDGSKEALALQIAKERSARKERKALKKSKIKRPMVKDTQYSLKHPNASLAAQRLPPLPGVREEEEKAAKDAEYLKNRPRKDAIYQLQPWQVIEKLRNELEAYIPGLSQRCKLIIANKIDVPGAKKNLEILRKKTRLPIIPVSARYGENLKEALFMMQKFLMEHQQQEQQELQQQQQQQHRKPRS